MPEVTSHEPGSFCWIELATTDVNAARGFYTSLFGWDVSEVPMGESGFYYMLLKNGRNVGALYEMYPQTREQGMPPNWMTYVAVDNADEAAERVKQLGGNVIAGPFDVFDSGRMAAVMDPQGAAFAVWQAKSHPGIGIRDDEGTLCWNELQATDVDGSRRFYKELFGWGMKESDEYTELYVGDRAQGGIMKAQSDDIPPHWVAYFTVADCDAAVAQAQSLGGNVYVPPMDIPGVGRFAVVADPQGAAFAVIKLALEAH